MEAKQPWLEVISAACNWQWNKTDLHNEFSDPKNPYSGACYDTQNVRKGGISDMGGIV